MKASETATQSGKHKLILLKDGKEVYYCTTEKEANVEIRLDPDFTHCGDLGKQSTYRIKVVAPHIIFVEFEQLEGSTSKMVFDKIKKGKNLAAVASYFNSAGSGVTLGYNKCRLQVTLSNGQRSEFRVDASQNDYSLAYQVQKMAPDVWVGKVTKEGYVY